MSIHYMIEVVADDRDDAAALIREAATKIKRGKEVLNREVNHCIGDYRISRVSNPDCPTKGAAR